MTSRFTTRVVLGVLSMIALALALAGPDLTVGAGGMPGMPMTHYMGLLAANQPWNLLLFMAAPVILAETLAITELVILLGHAPAWVHTLSRIAGILAGPLMLGILMHLTVHAVVPLSASGGWAGPADVIAVLSYLAGAVPMIGISLIEAGLLGRTERDRRVLHTVMVAIFLVVAHIAMIFGMLDPAVLGGGAGNPAGAMTMPAQSSGATTMPHDHGGMTGTPSSMPMSSMPMSGMPTSMPMSSMPMSGMPTHS